MAPGNVAQAALTWAGRGDPSERKLRNERGVQADVSLWLLGSSLLIPLPVLRIALVEGRPGLALSLTPFIVWVACLAYLATRKRNFYVAHREVLVLANMVLCNIIVRRAGQGGTNYFLQHRGSPARLAGLLLLTGHAVWCIFFPLYHRLSLGWSAVAVALSAFVPLTFGRSLCHRLLLVPGVHAPLSDLYSVLSVAHNIVAAPGSMAAPSSSSTPLQQCLALDAYFLVGLGCVLPLAFLTALHAHERRLAQRARQAAAPGAASAAEQRESVPLGTWLWTLYIQLCLAWHGCQLFLLVWRRWVAAQQQQSASTRLCAANVRGDAGTAAPGGPSAVLEERDPQQQCQLDIAASPLIHHCQRVWRVCVDQQQLIFHEQRHQPGGGREPDPLPDIPIHPTRLYFFPWTAGTKSDSSLGSDGSDGDAAGSGGGGTSGGDEDWGDTDDAAAAAGDGDAEEDAGAALRRLLRQEPRRVAYETHAPGEHFNRRRLLPMPTRPASALEPAPYLANPVFSTCTVPVVVYPIFAENFAHLFHDVAAFLHSLLRRTPWRAHARLVAFTPNGLALTQPEAQLLPALFNMSVLSWADFSRRLPPGYDPRADRQQSPPSWEGGEQRCFDSLLICGRKFKPDKPLELGLPQTAEEERARLKKAVPRENYGFGQGVVRWYRQRGLIPPPPKPAAASGSSSSSTDRSGRRLRVLFMRRDSGGRQLLTAEELARSCSTWRYQPPGGGGTVTAECRQVEMPNLEAGIAAAQEADVFIGMHGRLLPAALVVCRRLRRLAVHRRAGRGRREGALTLVAARLQLKSALGGPPADTGGDSEG
ncbi:hypothetical protein ABPG75_004259 [Micractinium tetrahymenae]